MDDLLNEFLTETSESLAVIDLELVKFERNPNDKEILQNIFRLVHTIKGTCGFLGLPRLESVAHAGENVLGKFRDGALEVTPEAVSLILRCIDRIRSLLGDLEANGEEPAGDDQQLIDELNAMADAGTAPKPKAKGKADKAEKPAKPAKAEKAETASPFPVAKELLDEVEQAIASGKKAASDDDIKAEMAKERQSEGAAAEASQAEPAEAAQVKASVPAVAADAGKALVKPDEGAASARESAVAAQSIRVNVELLEDLMTLVSELVLTRNQLLQMVRGRDDSEFKVPLQRLSHITTDLQEGVMKTRMQPIGNAWAKLPRIVRDLAVESGKKIDLQMIGADTELDRQVLELIKDPLTHMVRNSADHGLESPVDRRAKGKPETGVITLNAYHEGGHIIIEIADDGKGLSTAKIKAKAIQNGILSEADAEGMTEQQIQQYIMRPGFSTAEKVTSVSGRGVGMDVVKTNVEKIGGTIEFKSIEGRGTTFTIKIPLTLAIVSALIVECSGERFAIPQISVLELVRAAKGSDNCIEMINQAPVLRLRDRLLPLVSLRSLFRLGEGGEEAETSGNNDEVFIVVTQVGTYTFGIIVDRVYDTEEIVVKPVAPILRHIPYYSGNTILGDGSVIMILDPNGIASTTGQQEAVSAGSRAEAASTHLGGDETTSLLIFRAGGDELKAVPLALVARLEEIDMKTVEHSHGNYVVQYRGQLMPLVPFDPGHAWKSEGGQPILVFTEGERSMGLVVDEIVDIVDDKLKIELAANQSGLLGSAVINGKATDVVDAGHYLLQAFADWFGGRDAEAFESDQERRHVLLVDDSPFFLNLLGPMLTVAGYRVTTVKSAEEALALRDEGRRFDAIVSDIEMGGMNGFQFAQTVRSEGAWEGIPMVAMSSHAAPRDFERGREVGFTDYVAKYDRDGLIQTLAQTFRN